MADRITIQLPDGEVSGHLAGTGPRGVLLAHGAGTNQDHPFMVSLSDALAAAGHTVMTFNYRYTERGSKRPDRTESLVEVHHAAAEYLRERVDDLYLAGKSMGGRMATYLAADGYPAKGIVLFGYPLHPAGKEDRLRAAHLADVRAPMLFFQATRDALSRMELFDRHVRSLPNVSVELLEGASHSFRGGGWTEETMIDRLTTGTTKWIEAVSSGSTVDSRP